MIYKPGLTLEEKAIFQFQPAHLPSFQFLDTCRRKTYQQPERMLMLAVLEDAVAGIHKYGSVSKGKRKRWFHETIAWILTEDNDWVFSFNNVCEAVGLSPGYLRKALIRMARHARAGGCEAKSDQLQPSMKNRRRVRMVRGAA